MKKRSKTPKIKIFRFKRRKFEVFFLCLAIYFGLLGSALLVLLTTFRLLAVIPALLAILFLILEEQIMDLIFGDNQYETE